MNWINNVVRPKLQGIWKKKEVPDDLWLKCPESGQLIFHKDLEDNLYVVPGSDYHMRMKARDRLGIIFDDGEYELVKAIRGVDDPLKFKDQKKYTDRLKDARQKTGLDDSVLVAHGKLRQLETVVAVQDFTFMGGSLGTDAGGAIVAGMMKAIELHTPFIMFAASGGARMQEGIFSLMQMPRTTVAVQRLREAGLPYIVVLTDPTMGGVTASYAMLGDIQIAEPGALIGFAGPRVIEQTIREQLPSGFQRAEYLLDKGMVDLVVHRHKMRDTLARLCALLMKQPVRKEMAETDMTKGQSELVEIIRDPAKKGKAPARKSAAKSGAGSKGKTGSRKAKTTTARSRTKRSTSKKADNAP